VPELETVSWSEESESWAESPPGPPSGNLADILERVLDKGIVIAGDIKIDLLDIELLTIRLRLFVASVETAKKAGIDCGRPTQLSPPGPPMTPWPPRINVYASVSKPSRPAPRPRA
jgi:hypothetical protein